MFLVFLLFSDNYFIFFSLTNSPHSTTTTTNDQTLNTRASQDGVILCNAINAIKPKAVKRINKSKMPFKQMENISNFIKACRALGVPEHGLFTTPDLYDGKSIVNVTNGIVALGSKAQTIPGYSGPRIGAVDKSANIGSYTKGKSKSKVGTGGGGMSKMMMGSAWKANKNPKLCLAPEAWSLFLARSPNKNSAPPKAKFKK